MHRGVGSSATRSARSWGCAGVVLFLLAGCAVSPLDRRAAPPVPSDAEVLVARDVVERGETVALGDVAPPAVAPAPPPDGAAAIAPPPARFTGPPARAAAAPRFAGGPSGGGTWALVIGIDDYPGRGNDLRSAGNDADDMDRVLGRFGVDPTQRIRLSDGQADAATIRRAVDWIVDRAGPEASVVLFYAGHVRRLGGGREAIVAADGALVRDLDLARQLAPLQARRAWMVFASCFGGGFTELLAPGRILTGAAPADRLAYESIQLGRSYLGEYLVRRALLEGRAPATVEGAFAWAEAAIRRDHPNRVPVQFDHHEGDFVLGERVSSSSSPAAPGAPEPSPRTAPPPTTTTTAPPREEERSCGITMGTLLHCPE